MNLFLQQKKEHNFEFISGGQLDVCMWAYEQGFPWPAQACEVAVEYDRKEILHWARDVCRCTCTAHEMVFLFILVAFFLTPQKKNLFFLHSFYLLFEVLSQYPEF